MKNNSSSLTALISSFGRAYHSQFDHPKIFNDMIARQLLTDEEYEQIAEYLGNGIDFFAPEKKGTFLNQQEALKWIVQTQFSPTTLARSKYCEDVLLDTVACGTDQYVILGAGMDTFAYRHTKLLKKIYVYEVDHPHTQDFKKKKLKLTGWDIPENLHYVPMDFTKDDLVDELSKAGFSFQKPAFFSLLGITYYLSKEYNLNLLKTISTSMPKGSSIVFDYADEHLFKSDVERVQKMVALAHAGGEPMKSCYSFEELEKLLADSSFVLKEHLTTKDIEKRFFSNRSDDLHAFESINYVFAVI